MYLKGTCFIIYYSDLGVEAKMHSHTSPLIIVGMHRSGTGLLAKALHTCGVFMGASRSSHDEALFFLHQNQRIFQLAHANWDVPGPVEYLLNCHEIRTDLKGFLRKNINSLKIMGYLGLKNYLKFGGLRNINHPWGWKDPRNTYTLPLWLNIFVNARIVYIRRNGIDVANSLWRREKGRRNKLRNPLVSCRCMTLEGAFDLWSEYEYMGLQHIDALPTRQVLVIRYEDFLFDPTTHLNHIAQFTKTRFDSTRIEHFVEEIDPDRAYAFLDDDELYAFYEQKRQHPLMRRFYQDIPFSRL